MSQSEDFDELIDSAIPDPSPCSSSPEVPLPMSPLTKIPFSFKTSKEKLADFHSPLRRPSLADLGVVGYSYNPGERKLQKLHAEESKSTKHHREEPKEPKHPQIHHEPTKKQKPLIKPEPTLLQNTQGSDREMQVVQEAMADGFMKYGLPISAAAIAGTFIMRRRYRQFKSSSVENVLLSALHYYGALSLGLYTGMTLYAPEFESRVMEKAPNSNLARAIKDSKGYKDNIKHKE